MVQPDRQSSSVVDREAVKQQKAQTHHSLTKQISLFSSPFNVIDQGSPAGGVKSSPSID